MVTKANRQRVSKSYKSKVAMQADDVYVPSSIRKAAQAHHDAVMAGKCLTCDKYPCECNQGRGKALNDPLGDLCGEPWHPVAIYAISASIAFCGGLGLGWMVWA